MIPIIYCVPLCLVALLAIVALGLEYVVRRIRARPRHPHNEKPHG